MNIGQGLNSIFDNLFPSVFVVGVSHWYYRQYLSHAASGSQPEVECALFLMDRMVMHHVNIMQLDKC